ncbi:hypothetical protein CMI37_17805 [Candidatus Pacearchaeota archaeon]|nr:hypothetical protein [Candidatus Pacearchaeota archaeon]
MPVTEAEAAAAVPKQGWLRTYVLHALNQTTSPLVYHLGVGLTILGTTCPLAYGMPYAGTLRANNFCLLVGRSGEDQKSSALAVGKSILDQAAAPLIGDFPGSPEGLIDSLARRPSQFIPISEFGKFLSSAQRGYFEPTKTLLADLWDCCQGTEILTESGWKKDGEVKVGDTAICLDPTTDTLVHSKVLAVGSREVRPGEKMAVLKGHNHDIRTTEGHRYYIKYRDPSQNYKPSPRYLVKTGKEMAARRSSFYLPFSAEPTFDQPGVDLTDDELRFIAWALTDSSLPEVTGSGLNLYQAEHKHLDRIRALLQRLSLPYTEKVTAEKGRAQGQYIATSDIWTLYIKKADIAPYTQWLDKDLPLPLLKMSKNQFEVFWKELLLADGEQTEKGLKGLLWSTREPFIDRLQHLAVINGYATQYGVQELPSGKTAYRMSINPQRHVLTDPGNKKSIRFKLVNPEPGTRVWCATTEHGTLVTRRNGKVVILGNCHSTQRTKANNKIVRVDNPRLSIGAACSIPYLEKHTLAEDWTGGFMGRWMVLYGKRERNDPDPIGDQTHVSWLTTEIRNRATTTTAGFCMGLDNQARQRWAQWYNDITNRKLPENIIGIRSRAPSMARKAALIYGWDFGAALAGQPWLMGLDVLEPAIALIELHVKSLVHLSDVIAEHPDARLRRAVMQAIMTHGGVSTLGEILSILKMRKRPIAEMLDSLMEEGRVSRQKTTLGIVYTLHSRSSF